MSRPALVLFDDRVARLWRPFTLTRPAGELLFGTRTLRARAEQALGLECVGHLAEERLIAYDEPWAPPVLAPDRLPKDRDLVLLSSRFAGLPATVPDGPGLLTADGEPVGIRLAAGDPVPEGFLDDPAAAAPELPTSAVTGRLLRHVWELMSGSPDWVERDLAGSEPSSSGPDAPGLHVVGDGRIALGRDVRIGPGVVLDARHGPIRLDDGVEVRPFTVLAGPSYIGAGSTLLGGPFEAVTIGPVCKVHGEMEESVLLGYSNKAHDGFLGHAYLGMWVNLGALTTNSDLKNTYGSVRLWTPEGEVDTGERKVGCFLGDHVKTAIGTMLNTGTVIGSGSNVFGGMPPRYVPPFSWGDPDTVYDVDRFLGTAATVMGRRDIEMSESQRTMLRAAWSAARG